MVLERFWTSGKQNLLVFTGFCERNAWQTLVFAGFSRIFCDFINCLNQLTGLACWQNVTPARARVGLCSYTSLSLILGGIAGVRSLSILSVTIYIYIYISYTCPKSKRRLPSTTMFILKKSHPKYPTLYPPDLLCACPCGSGAPASLPGKSHAHKWYSHHVTGYFSKQCHILLKEKEILYINI